MAGKQFCSIDFVIEGNIYYSRKALIESSSKPKKATVVVPLIFFIFLDHKKAPISRKKFDP